MLLTTYQSIIDCFKRNHGYMKYSQLRENQVTVLQIRELEERGILQKISWGWYWCDECGFEKPKDYKYVEIAKVNPKAVICLDSACYLNGILKEEPNEVAVATERSDRKKMEIYFPIRRFYLQNTNIDNEISWVKTDFGDYQYYSEERTFCDCFRMKKKLKPDCYLEIENVYRQRQIQKDRILVYAEALRAAQNIKNVDGTMKEDKHLE